MKNKNDTRKEDKTDEKVFKYVIKKPYFKRQIGLDNEIISFLEKIKSRP